MSSDNFTLMLDRSGDTAISWNDENDLEVLSYIQKKMNEGYIFFIMDEHHMKITGRQRFINSVNDITKERKVYMDDKEVADLFQNQKVDIVKVDLNKGNELTLGGRRAKSAKEVVKNKTTAIKPVRGG